MNSPVKIPLPTVAIIQADNLNDLVTSRKYSPRKSEKMSGVKVNRTHSQKSSLSEKKRRNKTLAASRATATPARIANSCIDLDQRSYLRLRNLTRMKKQTMLATISTSSNEPNIISNIGTAIMVDLLLISSAALSISNGTKPNGYESMPISAPT